MPEPKILRDMLPEAVEVLWRAAQATIPAHDAQFAREHPVVASYGQPETPGTETR